MSVPLYISEGRAGPWHGWFAWHPVRLECGCLAWLRSVQRRRFKFADWFCFDGQWEYRR